MMSRPLSSSGSLTVSGGITFTTASPRPHSSTSRPSSKQRRCAPDPALQLGAAPQLQRRRRGHQRELVGAEGAGVLARLPEVELGPDQQDGQRQAVPAERLRHRHQVRDDTRVLETEERTGTAAAALDLVADQQRAVPVGQLPQVAQPARGRRVDAAVHLHRLHDHRGRLGDPGGLVAEQPLQVRDRVERAAGAVFVRHERGVRQRDPGGGAGGARATDRQRAVRHAVERSGERDDALPPGHLPGQLERRLHRVRAGRAAELHLVVQAGGPQHQLPQPGQERAFGQRVHVQAVGDAVGGHVLQQPLFEVVVVVPVVQRAGAADEVQVATPVLGDQMAALRPGEHRREGPAVQPYVRLQVFRGGRRLRLPGRQGSCHVAPVTSRPGVTMSVMTMSVTTRASSLTCGGRSTPTWLPGIRCSRTGPVVSRRHCAR